MEPSGDQVGTKWDQMKLGPMGYPKKVDFSLVLKGFLKLGPMGYPKKFDFSLVLKGF